MAKFKDWYVGCYCGKRFNTVISYAEHMIVHPLKCVRCRDFYNNLPEYLAHSCKVIEDH